MPAFDCLVLRMRGLLVSYPVLVNQHAATVEDVVGGIDRDKTGVGQNNRLPSVRGDLCRVSRVRVLLSNHFSFVAESLP